jgi:hypothetical protein
VATQPGAQSVPTPLDRGPIRIWQRRIPNRSKAGQRLAHAKPKVLPGRLAQDCSRTHDDSRILVIQQGPHDRHIIGIRHRNKVLKAQDAKSRIRVRELFVEKAPQLRCLWDPKRVKANSCTPGSKSWTAKN